MVPIGTEAVELQHGSAHQRLSALKSILPPRKVPAALHHSGGGQRHCPRVGDIFMIWFVIAEEQIPSRRNRINPRVIKRQQSQWPPKRPRHRLCPQPTASFRESVVILR
jgi:hypothetical protein